MSTRLSHMHCVFSQCYLFTFGKFIIECGAKHDQKYYHMEYTWVQF
jgi:hypothetical protein